MDQVATEVLMTPGLAFSIDMMGRGNGAVLRGHKQHIGTTFW